MPKPIEGSWDPTPHFTTKEISSYINPPGWKPECNSIACYIKKQHPSQRTKIIYSEDVEGSEISLK